MSCAPPDVEQDSQREPVSCVNEKPATLAQGSGGPVPPMQSDLHCGDREVRGLCSLFLQVPRSPTFPVPCQRLLEETAGLYLKEAS